MGFPSKPDSVSASSFWGRFPFLILFIYLCYSILDSFNFPTLFFLWSLPLSTHYFSIFSCQRRQQPGNRALLVFGPQKETDYHCFVQKKTCFPYLISFVLEKSCPIWKIIMFMGLWLLWHHTGDKPLFTESDRIVVYT